MNSLVPRDLKSEDGALSRLEEMKGQIAHVTDLWTAKETWGVLKGLEQYAKSLNATLRLQNTIAEVRLRMERRAAALIKEHKIRPGNPQLSSTSTIGKTPVLSDFGINRNQSSTWQRVLSVPEEVFDAYIQQCMDDEAEITRSGVLNLFRLEKRARKKEKLKEEIAATPPGTDEMMILATMQDAVPALAPKSVHLLLTDPPYGLGETSRIGFAQREDMNVPRGEWDASVDFESWIRLLRRPLKDDASLYIFVQDKKIAALWTALAVNSLIPRKLLVWHKSDPQPHVRHSGYPQNSEYIIYATVGDAYTFNWLDDARMDDVLSFPTCKGNERVDHPTQKPLALLRFLIRVSSNKGHLVLDPFAGVGSTGVAAKELDRSYILIEKETYYHGQARFRLRSAV